MFNSNAEPSEVVGEEPKLDQIFDGMTKVLVP